MFTSCWINTFRGWVGGEMHIKIKISQQEPELGLSLAINKNMLKIDIFKALFALLYKNKLGLSWAKLSTKLAN